MPIQPCKKVQSYPLGSVEDAFENWDGIFELMLKIIHCFKDINI